MYFQKFPQLKYNLNNKNYNLLDIFRRVKFDIKTLQNKEVFFEYYMVDGDNLELLSRRYYGTPDYWWLFILSNNILNNLEIPTDENTLQSYIDSKYYGKALFFLDYMPEIKPGDLLVKVTLTGNAINTIQNDNYGIVVEYNELFRFVRIKEINGTISANDNVGFFRNTFPNSVFHSVIRTSGGAVEQSNWANVKKIIDYKDAPIQFKNTFGNYHSPYYVNENIEINSTKLGIYSASSNDINTIGNTSLYNYVSGTPDSNIASLETYKSKVIKDNEKYRIIKILNPIYINRVASQIYSLINSDSKILTIEI